MLTLCFPLQLKCFSCHVKYVRLFRLVRSSAGWHWVFVQQLITVPRIIPGSTFWLFLNQWKYELLNKSILFLGIWLFSHFLFHCWLFDSSKHISKHASLPARNEHVTVDYPSDFDSLLVQQHIWKGICMLFLFFLKLECTSSLATCLVFIELFSFFQFLLFCL